ncbi:hypothetical protein APUTEX25_004053, partial [Auxenochlorella protothecoides]
NTDVVAWCPSSRHTDLLAVGTYQLDESSGLRAGHAYMYRVRREGPEVLQLEAEARCAGVFDLAWHPSSSSTPLLAMALSDGTLRLTGQDLVTIASSTPQPDSDALACCVDWRRDGQPPDTARLLASYSDGDAARLQATPAGLTTLERWSAHSLEAWAVAADPWQPALCFTGGDDCALRAWDERAPASPAWADRREHGAGVCCILPSTHTEHLVATGSYDEAARAWDLRWPGRPLLLSKARGHLVLAACMQHGFQVLRLRPGSGEWAVEERYAHQQTLAYGADWQRRGGDQAGPFAVATASFYDNALH